MPQMSLLRARFDTDGTCPERWSPITEKTDRPDRALRLLQ